MREGGIRSSRGVCIQRSSSTSILVFDVRDTRAFDMPARKKIISVAVSGFGDVAGYVLNKNGTSVCSF